jgi:hypothetical protein
MDLFFHLVRIFQEGGRRILVLVVLTVLSSHSLVSRLHYALRRGGLIVLVVSSHDLLIIKSGGLVGCVDFLLSKILGGVRLSRAVLLLLVEGGGVEGLGDKADGGLLRPRL